MEEDYSDDVYFIQEVLSDEINGNNVILNDSFYDFSGQSLIINTPMNIISDRNSTLCCSCLWISSNNVTISGVKIIGAILSEKFDRIRIENCTLINPSDNFPSISITESTGSVLDNVTVKDSPSSPAFVAEKCKKLVVQNSTFTDLSGTAMIIQNTEAVIDNCSVSKLGDVAFYIISSPSTEIKNCTFFDIMSTVISGLFSQIFITKSTFNNIEHNALTFHQCISVNITECEINKISGAAITASKSCIFVANNKFSENKVSVHSSAETRYDIVENEISNCDTAFILYRGCFGQISFNKINKIKYSAINVRGATNASFESNTISDVEECGFSVSDTNTCTLTKNIVSNCKVSGIEVFNAAKVTLFLNKFDNVGKYGIRSLISSNVKATKNTFSHIETFLMLSTNGSADLRNNDVLFCKKQYEGILSGNVILYNNGCFENITTVEEIKDFGSFDSLMDVQAEDDIKFVKRVEENDELCFVCKEKKRTSFCIPCGHKVFCEDCCTERCPLCRCIVTGKTHEFATSADESCILCVDGHADSIVLPCGHSGMCHQCLEKWFKENTSCPICRQENSHYREIISEI